MPQLDPATFSSQLFWLVIFITILTFVMTKFLLPKVSRIFEARGYIKEQALQVANQSKDEAESLKKELEEQLNDAKNNARKALDQVMVEMALQTQEEYLKLEKEFVKKTEQSELKIEDFKKEASSQLAEVSTQSVKIALKKFAGLEIADNKIKEAIDNLRSNNA